MAPALLATARGLAEPSHPKVRSDVDHDTDPARPDALSITDQIGELERLLALRHLTVPDPRSAHDPRCDLGRRIPERVAGEA